MTKREAKIEALRTAVAMLNNPPCDWDDTEFNSKDVEKILQELNKIASELQNRATKLGGEFNPFSGFVDEK